MRFVALLLAVVAFPAAARAPSVALSPGYGVVGSAIAVRGVGFAPNVPVEFVWFSAAPHWRVRDGRFYGIRAAPVSRVLARATTGADGSVAMSVRVPEDFGYVHDVELRSAGASVRSGFTVVPRLAIEPASGPPGTPISVTLTGLGYGFYQLGWHVSYDGAQTGWASAITTHGTARFALPASGAIGAHVVAAIEGPGAPYLNETQSPNYNPAIPTVVGATFDITPGAPVLPQTVAAGVAAATGTGTSRAGASDRPSVVATVSSGTVGSPLGIDGRAFAPGSAIDLRWDTVIGNRISGNGWERVTRTVAHARANADGTFHIAWRVPDDVGGEHVLTARSGSATATAPFLVVPSVEAIRPALAHPGETISVIVHGVGWSETGNIYTLVMDNAYVGYGCGFNSHGDAAMQFLAPGSTGPHFVDLYPAIYRGKIVDPLGRAAGSSVSGNYFLQPMLNAADHPGEALPVFHLSFEVRDR